MGNPAAVPEAAPLLEMGKGLGSLEDCAGAIGPATGQPGLEEGKPPYMLPPHRRFLARLYKVDSMEMLLSLFFSLFQASGDWSSWVSRPGKLHDVGSSWLHLPGCYTAGAWPASQDHSRNWDGRAERE